jgi:hypothetical protein
MALVAVVGATARCERISRDELRCEEAVAHVGSCCPGTDLSAIQCRFTGQGCGGSLPSYECLLDLSCDAMRARGVCDASPSAPPAVCP